MKRVVSERRGRGKAAAEIEMLAVSRNAEQSVELLSKEKCSSEGVIAESIQLKQNVAEDAVGKADQKEKKRKEKGVLCCFVGEPIPEEEARRRWQWRYDLKVSSC